MKNPLILTFDIGTQSMRAMFVNKNGEILDIVQEKYEQPYFSKQPNWAEQKPNFYFEVLCRVSKQLIEKRPDLIKDTIAMSITTIRDTVLCLDKDNKPLRDIIVWLDKREADILKPIPKVQRLAFRAVKMEDTIDMQQKASVCNWIMEKQPEIWAKTEKFVLLPTYLNYLLTGNLIDSIANMVGHLPVDYKNRCWLKAHGVTRCIADIPKSKLIDTVEAGEIIGYITKEVSEMSKIPEGLALIATGTDKACETLGLSVINENQASLSFGTAATVQITNKKFIEPQPFIPAYPAAMRGFYNTEIQVYRGYWMLSWFKREFAEKEVKQAKELGISAEELLNQRLSEIPAGCEGLILQPYWGPGVATPNGRGSIIGFSDVHTRIHLYRAIIEGIGFALLDGLKDIEKRGKFKVDEIFVGGGGSRSDEICQITANMFGVPIKRIQTHEACGVGASLIAFVGMGEFDSYEDGVRSMCHTKDTFIPDFEEHQIYDKLYKQIYCNIFEKLEPLYKQIKKIIKKK